MQTIDYLKFLQEDIHSTVMATVDGSGNPVTCAIDLMDCDENSLYFLTAKGKSFYSRLKARGCVALTGMKGSDTMSCIAVSVQGKVKELGSAKLQQLFDKNTYMNEIYPEPQTRSALTVFQIYEGTGEWFNLSKKPIERAPFTFGGASEVKQGYFVKDNCIGCKLCYSKCPTKCIDISKKPAIIKQENCIRCGNCAEVCPVGAAVKL